MLFVGIAALAPAVYLAFQLVLGAIAGVSPAQPQTGAAPVNPTAVFKAAGVTMVAALLGWLLGYTITQAATIYAVSRVHLGRPVTITEAYRSLSGRIGRILLVFILVALIVIGVSLVIIIVATLLASLVFIGAGSQGTAGMILGGLFALGVTVIAALLAVTVYVRYSLAVQACVVENITARQSLKRSAFLSKGSRGRILTVLTVFFVLNLIIGYALLLSTRWIGVVTGQAIITTVITYLTSFASGALTGPLATIALSLVYFDERVRKEAFDLQLMMSALDGETASAAPTNN